MNTKISVKDTCKHLLYILKPFKLCIFTMLMATFYYAFVIALNPYLIRTIINRVDTYTEGNLFAILAGPVIIYVIAQFFLSAAYRLYDYLAMIKMFPALRAHVTNVAMDLLFKQSHTYFQNHLSGNLSSKVSDLVSSVPELLQTIVDRFVFLTLVITFSIITLSVANIKFGLIMFVWASTFAIYAALKASTITHLARNWAEIGSSIIGRIVDLLANFLSLQLFSAKKYERDGLNTLMDQAIVAERKLQWQYFYIFLVYGISALILTCLSFYYLIKGRQEGTITTGDFGLVLFMNIAVMDQIWALAKDFAQFSKLFGRISQALSLILMPSEMLDAPNAKELQIIAGQITFDQVYFSYKGHASLFNNKTVTISPGQRVGLVGYSGSGKTTFVNLILRLYDVNSGAVLIDQQNIKDVTQDSLHDAIGMIPQDPLLFHRSLLENIRFANPTATDEDIYLAAKRAHADEFINKLPNRYASIVGERGIKLSGGQRQRVAIARAMLKNAPILILDEATSQLDSVTEQYIQDSLWDLMQNKTSIVIAHRLSTLLRMDRILVFDNGKIIEDGTHKELLAKHGLYKTLWEAQVGGFLPEDKS